MSLFTKLPELAIEDIITILLNTEVNRSDHFKGSLQLLSVCQAWRKVGLPLVYRYVYIQQTGTKGDGFNCDLGDKFSHTRVGITNIGLVRAVNQTALVRTVDIELDRKRLFKSLVNDANSIFRFKDTNWSGVSKLNIDLLRFDIDEDEEDHMDLESTINDEMLTEFAKSLVSAMPNVTKLTVSSGNEFSWGRKLNKLLLQMYGKQLSTVNCTQSAYAMENMDCLLQPENLFLSFSGNTQRQIPSVNVDNLVSLKLLKIYSTFDWSIFHNTLGKEPGFFPYLKYLTITFSDINQNRNTIPLETSDTNTQCNSRVFPCLEYLTLNFSDFKSFKSVFSANSYIWPIVKSLAIRVETSEDSSDTNEYLNIDSDLMAIAGYIVQTMPHITKLNIDGSCFTSKYNNNRFSDKLISHYVNQLKYLTTMYPSNIAIPNSALQLRHLVLDFEYPSLQSSHKSENRGDWALLQIIKHSAQTLQHLEMDSVPNGFSWNFDNSEKRETSVGFYNLQELRIIYKKQETDLISDYQGFMDWDRKNTSAATVLCPKLVNIMIRRASYCGLKHLFGPGLHQWPCVREFILMLVDYHGHLDYKAILTDIEFNNSMAKFVTLMTDRMPNISKLFCIGNSTDDVEIQMHSLLVVHYMKQLKRVWCTTPISFSVVNESKGLHTLELNYNMPQKMKELPNINPEYLTQLSIGDVPGDYTWEWFSKNSISGNVEFNDLEFVVLRQYNLVNSQDETHNDGSEDARGQIIAESLDNSQKTIVNMPAVKNIHIRTDGDIPGLGNSELYFDRVNQVDISGSVASIPFCGNQSSDILGRLGLNIASVERSKEMQFYQVTNSWLSGSRYINNSSLELGEFDFVLQGQYVDWTILQKLAFTKPVNIEPLVNILPKLSCLKKLFIMQLVVDGMPEMWQNVHPFEPLCEGLVEPLSKSVCDINVYTLANKEDQEQTKVAHNALAYLALAVTSLQLMRLDNIDDFDLSVFDDVDRAKYPHVRDLRVMCQDSPTSDFLFSDEEEESDELDEE